MQDINKTSFVHFIRRITIGNRLNLGFFLVSIVPVFIICMFAYQKTFEETYKFEDLPPKITMTLKRGDMRSVFIKMFGKSYIK